MASDGTSGVPGFGSEQYIVCCGVILDFYYVTIHAVYISMHSLGNLGVTGASSSYLDF